MANVLLTKTKGQNSGWIVITFGWAMAVFLGVYASTNLGGSGHLNPAITIALTAFGDFDSSLLLTYIAAQFGGAIVGASIAWLAYKQHFDATADKDLKMAVFCNSPAIRNVGYNLITEIIGTFVLIFGALTMSKPSCHIRYIRCIACWLAGIGYWFALGGPTGYAINPARDLGPRIAHFILPIPGKRDSDWGYSWIPVVGPIVGALVAAGLFRLL